MFNWMERPAGALEICDECGFHAGELSAAEAAARLRLLGPAWATVLAHSEELVRTRPEPATYCAVEYAQHSINAICEIEWAASRVANGEPLDWDLVPATPGVFDHEVHDCGRFGIDQTLAEMVAAAESMAVYLLSLDEEQLTRRGTYADGLILDTLGVIVHALHDAEHHVLDSRRGIARQELATGRAVL